MTKRKASLTTIRNNFNKQKRKSFSVEKNESKSE